jgi:hypothetical protein
MSLWIDNYSDATGWKAGPEYYSTIQFNDLNADGLADVCGRGAAGIYCAFGSGYRFGSMSLWDANYSDANGWNARPYYTTIRLTDVTGDRKADVCGRGAAGIYCTPSTGSSFNPLSLWIANYSDANGWNRPEYYSTIRLR